MMIVENLAVQYMSVMLYSYISFEPSR